MSRRARRHSCSSLRATESWAGNYGSTIFEFICET